MRPAIQKSFVRLVLCNSRTCRVATPEVARIVRDFSSGGHGLQADPIPPKASDAPGVPIRTVPSYKHTFHDLGPPESSQENNGASPSNTPIRPTKSKEGTAVGMSNGGTGKVRTGSNLDSHGEAKGNGQKRPVKALTEKEMAAVQQLFTNNRMQIPKSPVDSNFDLAKTSVGAISILEELFPEELGRKKQPAKGRRHIPKAALAVGIPKDREGIERPAQRDSESFPDPEVTARGERGAVLCLRKASKHLTDHDFRRVMPGGKHIAGWSQQGELLKVIRLRFKGSLDSRGKYYLVFSTVQAAQAYLENAKRNHAHSRINTPRSMFSPLPPPPTLDEATGEIKFTDPVYSFTLKPPSQDLDLLMLKEPYHADDAYTIKLGGMASIARDQVTPYEVLLRLTNVLDAPARVWNMISSHGQSRGVAWQVAQKGGPAIRAVAELQPVASEESPSDEAASDQRPSNERPSRMNRKFIVSFASAEEADRFALALHRTDVSRHYALDTDYVPETRPVMSLAERV